MTLITFNRVPLTGNNGYFENVKLLNLNINDDMTFMKLTSMRAYNIQVINSRFQINTGEIKNSIFLNSPLVFNEENSRSIPRIENNTFVMDGQIRQRFGPSYGQLLSIYGYGDDEKWPYYAIRNNSFLTPKTLDYIIDISSRTVEKPNLTNNYWETIDSNFIKNEKLGGKENILFEPFLKESPAVNIKYYFPTEPLVEPINKDDKIVKGKGTPGQVIKIIINKFDQSIVQVGKDGSFSYQIPNSMYIDLDSKIQAIQLDENGIGSEFVLVEVEDITPPNKPFVYEVTELSEVVIGEAEPGAKIEITLGGSVITTGTATSTGYFSIPIPRQKAGTVLEITATDGVGNVSEVTKVVVKDVTAPTSPMVNEVTDKSTSVTGTSEAGSTITVKTGASVLGTATTTAEGKYSVTIAKQKAGTTLTVTATDEAGNVSEVKEITVKDVTAPTSPMVNEVTDKSTSVTGTSEAGSTITVKVGATVIGTATTTTEGKYSVTIAKQKAGTTLRVTAADEAGNVSEVKEVTVKDVTAPTSPMVNEVTDKSTSVTGTSEAGSTSQSKQERQF